MSAGALTASAERALYERDRTAWLGYAAPRIAARAALSKARGDA